MSHTTTPTFTKATISATYQHPFLLEGRRLRKYKILQWRRLYFHFKNAIALFRIHGAPNATITSSTSSTNRPSSNIPGESTHHTRATLGTQNYLLFDTLYSDIRHIYHNATLSPSEILSNQTQVKFAIIDDLTNVTSGADLQTFSYTKLEFPSTLNLSDGNNYNGDFTLDRNTISNKSRLDINNWAASNPMVFVLGSNPKQIKLYPNGTNNYRLLVPNDLNGQDQKVIYLDSNTFVSPGISKINSDGLFTNFTTTPDDALLMVYHDALKDASESYRDYRTSAIGGNYTTVFANIDELYMQFGGGIPNHINAVRRFAHAQYEQSSVKPSGLFLLGKGIKEAHQDNSQIKGSRQTPYLQAANLIPSFGQPSSDAAITASLIPNNWAPLIPTGRISALSNEQLQNYLDKVMDFELAQNQGDIYNSESKDWQKQVLHFGGGSDANQQSTFKNYLETMESIIEGTNYGGSVTKVYKTNSDPI